MLKASVNDIGEVDYAKLKGNTDLERYVGIIEKSSPRNQPDVFLSKADQLAYYINAYNAVVMSAVVKKYPVKIIGASFAFAGQLFPLHQTHGRR